MKMFNKDMLVSKALKSIANYFISDYGTLSYFSVDSSKKSIDLTVMLNGELTELNLKLFNYFIFYEEDKAFFSFESIHFSRQWLNMLYQNKFKSKEIKFEIPSNFAKPLKMFI